MIPKQPRTPSWEERVALYEGGYAHLRYDLEVPAELIAELRLLEESPVWLKGYKLLLSNFSPRAEEELAAVSTGAAAVAQALRAYQSACHSLATRVGAVGAGLVRLQRATSAWIRRFCLRLTTQVVPRCLGYTDVGPSVLPFTAMSPPRLANPCAQGADGVCAPRSEAVAA